MTLSRATVIKALEGVLLIRNPVLWEDNGRPTAEHSQAIQSALENFAAFQRVVQDELGKFPQTNRFVGHLINERLLQNNPLASPIIPNFFPVGPIELEDRLNRIKHIPNIETVTSNVHASGDPDKGEETDEIIRDVWAEFFVADFLVRVFTPSYVEKVVRGKLQSAVEFYLRQGGEEWIVEVARLRKKDFKGETMPWGSQDCIKKENVERIQKALHSKLKDKNKQIQKFISNEKRNFDKRIVVIKTSQEEYQDCKDVVAAEAKRLLKDRSYPVITHILIIYDTETYDLVENYRAYNL